MKKLYLFALGTLVGSTVLSQSMNENFDSYSAASYMGVNSANWSTWSGTTGGAEDVQVSTAQANSGANSIYFSSTAQTGGPQDVIVSFQGTHNRGHFNWSSMFYVESNKGAYFNFQGESTPGQTWTLNCQMDQNGNIQFDDSYAIWAESTFTHDTWFEIEVDVDLNNNFWEILIDGNSLGKFQNEVSQLSTMDIYPVNNSDNGGNNVSGFYMDDFQYTYTPYTLPSVNGAVTFIGDFSKVAGPPDVAGVVGSAFSPVVTVRNLGSTAITSFDLEIAHNGSTHSESITGVSLPSLGYYEYEFLGGLTLTSGQNDVSVTISNVNNGGADDDANDDSKALPVDPITPAAGKVVFVEEGTGTWCQWCPRGAVMMDRMQKLYPDLFAGVAVHNGDPMTYAEYDAGIGGLVGGYPSALVERGSDIDPIQIETQFLQKIIVAPTALIENGAEYNAGTGELKISVTADFQSTVSGQWKLACVIAEDSVTGSGSGWSQSNAYAGGNNGPMGGFESLPSSVPASQMVYNHVGRVILPDFNGHENSFPSTNAGDVHTVNFVLNVDPNWDLDQIHIVGILIAPNGTVDNADKTTISEAVANGFINASEQVTGITDIDPFNGVDIYPNPTDGQVIMNWPGHDVYKVIIYDLSGKEVYSNNSFINNKNVDLDLEPGTYLINLIDGENVHPQKLVIK